MIKFELTVVGHWFKLLLILALTVPLTVANSPTVQADTEVGGPIFSDTTWIAANSPYIVIANVEVWEGVTLTIEPGVVVRFNGEKKLQVNGELITQGTATNPITFTSNQLSPQPGDWAGIYFADSAVDATFDSGGNYTGGSVLQYCIVEYGGYEAAAIGTQNASPLIDHCTVRNNKGTGIQGVGTASVPIIISNNTVSGNTAYDAGGIYVYYGTVTDNTVSGNDNASYYGCGGGIWADNSTVKNNIVSDNSASHYGGSGSGICASNSTMTGNIVSYNWVPLYGSGGGINASYSTVSNNTVSSNFAGYGGGISTLDSTVTGNIVSGNSASQGVGGGIDAYGGTVNDNTVISNWALDDGGGIFGSNTTVTGNTVSGNSASGSGGGIYVYVSTVSGNSVTGNSIAATGRGSGVYYTDGVYDGAFYPLSNNTIVGNSGPWSSTVGGLEIDGTPPVHHNNFYNNSPYDVTIVSSEDISGTNNYWGTVSSVDILGQVYDWYDDSSRGKFIYIPYLSEPPIPPPPLYSISGRIRDDNGNPVSDVTISAAAGTFATTDASGYYTITYLITGTYTLIPSKSGSMFSPATRTVSVPPSATGQDFTATPTLLDIGFRPDPDGYSFSNYGGLFPLPPIDFTADDVVRMFGPDAACAVQWPVCILKRSAIIWEWNANWVMNKGHCDGMASTSLRFFKGLDNPADFQAGASTTHNLWKGNVRRHIAYYFVKQLTDPVRAHKEQVRQNTPSAILNQLRSAMSDGASDPTTLFVRQAGKGGHAITPYAIEARGNGVYWVWVYDNNHPDDDNRYVEINTTDDTWSYNLGSLGTWSGNTDTHTLGIVPISKYAEQPVCPWCSGNGARTLNRAPPGEVWLIGQGHLLITNVREQRIGYIGDQFVNEIPGAYESIVDGGLGVKMEPIYTLPLSETYTILLDGQTLTQMETVSVTQFGPGYAVLVGDVALGPASQDRLTVAPDGTQLAYQSNDDREATLTLALDGTSEGDQLQIKGADVGAGQTVTLTANIGSGWLVFDNSRASGGTYDLDIVRVSSAGEQKFIHADVVISATDTHYIHYGGWNGSGSIILDIDHGSDGTIDETLELGNQDWRLYLPVILRNYRGASTSHESLPTPLSGTTASTCR